VSARAQVLANIRHALGRDEPLTETMQQSLEQRVQTPTVHIRPALKLGPVEQFVAKLRGSGASVEQIAQPAELPASVAAFAATHDLPRRCVLAKDPLLESCEWSSEWDVAYRAAMGEDLLSITVPFAAVAETGTLAFVSGPASPTTLNFLPDNHLVALREEDVLPNLEDVFARLRTQHSGMPRTLNLISGPSKTADVEQTIVIGAHGPRRLHVLLIAA